MAKTIKIGGRLESVETGNIVTGANQILDDEKGKKQSVINGEVDAELVRLGETKQDVLTFDYAPTEGSNNPVKSGGVYTADALLQQAIEAILVLIPSAASALNKLVDEQKMNSSISTNTATFRGTYNSVVDLHLAVDATHQQIADALDSIITTADNNDYSYVQIPVSAQTYDIRKTERYKYNGTAWAFEYNLNTSGFTADQWAAINSGVNATIVGEVGDIQNVIPSEATIANKLTDKAYVDALIEAITELIPSEASTSNQLADKAYVIATILAAIPAFKGTFETLAGLEAVPSPKDGDIGIVLTTADDGLLTYGFYQYLNNDWNQYYTLSQRPKDKPASTGITGDYPYNGMGRVVLQKNIVSNVNTLTQDMFNKGEIGSRVPNTNTVFVIQHDFVLNSQITAHDASTVGETAVTVDGVRYFMCAVQLQKGKAIITNFPIFNADKTELLTDGQVYCAEDDITVNIAFTAEWSISNAYKTADFISIPNNSVLLFEGGSISNGVVKFNDTQLVLEGGSFDDCLFAGAIKGKEVKISSFSPKCSAGEDDSWLLNSVIDICNEHGVEICLDFEGDLYVSKPTVLEYPYCLPIRNEIHCKDNTHLKQTSLGWIKLQEATNNGGMVISPSLYRESCGTVIDGLRVDGNNIKRSYFGENGISVSGVVKNCVVKNCIAGDFQEGTSSSRPQSGYGGKGYQTEAKNREVFLENCKAVGCSYGFAYNRDKSAGKDINATVVNFIAEGCDTALLATAQSSVGQNYKSNNLIISNAVFKDCVGSFGVIQMQAIDGVILNAIKIVGTSKANSIIRGTCGRSNLDINVLQDAKYLFDLSAIKIQAYDDLGYGNVFTIHQESSIDYLFGSSDDIYPEGVTPPYPYLTGYNSCVIAIKGYTLINSDLKDNISNLPNRLNDSSIEIATRNLYYKGNISQYMSDLGTNYIRNTRPDNTVGPTANRPSLLVGGHKGFQYIDTTIGKPIYWFDAWKYADGTPVE